MRAGRREPVRDQAVKWCVCGEWFASERCEQEHLPNCPGPRERAPYLNARGDLVIPALPETVSGDANG